jgi:hypothetical protein
MRALAGLVLLAVVLRYLLNLWAAGELSTVSFWILIATGVFELACLSPVFWGFSVWEDFHLQGKTDEARRADNRIGKKRFG